MVQRAHLWRGRLLSPGFSCAASVRHVIADLLLFCMPPLASVCSAHFLNNGFCCRMVHVDSKRAAVTLVSSQQILIPVEASRPPGRALRAPLSLVSLLLRQLQHKVGRVGGVVCVCVLGGHCLPNKGSPFSWYPFVLKSHPGCVSSLSSLAHVFSSPSNWEDASRPIWFLGLFLFHLGGRIVTFY